MNIITSWSELTSAFGTHGWAIVVLIILPFTWVIYRALSTLVSDSGGRNMVTRIFCMAFMLSIGIPLWWLGIDFILGGQEVPGAIYRFCNWLHRVFRRPQNAIPYVFAIAIAYRTFVFVFRVTLKLRGLYILDAYRRQNTDPRTHKGQDAENVRIANNRFGYRIKIYNHLWCKCIKFIDVCRIEALDNKVHLIS